MTNRIATTRHKEPIIKYITARKVFFEPKRLAVDRTKYFEEPKELIS